MNNHQGLNSPSSFSNSPIINYRKDAKKGIRFTFMVVGESGTGKTTFVNSLLDKKVLKHRFDPASKTAAETETLLYTSADSVALPNISSLTRNEFDASASIEEPGIALTCTKVEMVDDDNTKLLLNIIDTPGFGDNLNNEICFVEIENYLKSQFDSVLAEETRIKRSPKFVDTRVHAMLYFIAPTGHGLREIDINCMKRLSRFVNVIPVIGRSDSFTQKELTRFKEQIRVDIEKFNIPVFQLDNSLTEYDSEDDYDLIQEHKYLASIQPFAIICSEDSFEILDPASGKTKNIKARKYPWGLADINDTSYSDFPYLRSVLLGSHLQDLKDLTHDFLYETYRTERLTKVAGDLEPEDDNDQPHDEIKNGFAASKDTVVPSFSNLAQLASTNQLSEHLNGDDTSINSKSSYKAPKSMLLDGEPSLPSPKLNDNSSFTSSISAASMDLPTRLKDEYSINGKEQNSDFKRHSIAPQRNQLRQISETVPYVIRQERLLERQQKLEEMEMASAKELSLRAAMLEKKAALLKAREKALMRKMQESGGERFSSASSLPENDYEGGENIEQLDNSSNYGQPNGKTDAESFIRKDETLTDLHSIASKRN